MNKKETEEFAVMKNEITHIKRDVEEIKKLVKEHIEWESKKYKELKDDYVSQEQFSPVRSVVYGLVSVILLAVASSVIYLVVV